MPGLSGFFERKNMSFNPDNPRRKALIAMSGGVDSSVAAYLAIESGLDCIGVTMKLFDNEDAGISREKSCCSLEDTEYARGVAYRLGMPYYVFNFTADFKEQVMRRFVEAYERGATPNPCIDCNRYLKFDRLYRRAKELGCEYVVTGHYARIEEENGRFLLKKAVDPTKDQSYVLYSMTQDELRHTLFPLGGMTKMHTRELARKLGFYNADKPDSQDICFVPDGDYASFIRSFTGRDYPRGEFVDKSGNVLGEHRGLIGYTVGQRKGLGIALGEPRYVTALMPKENRVVLGSNEDLMSRELDANNFNFIAFDTPPAEFRASARVRYRQAEQPATVRVTGEDTVHITFDEPQRAITKGQAVVVYDGDVVIGGGEIC